MTISHNSVMPSYGPFNYLTFCACSISETPQIYQPIFIETGEPSGLLLIVHPCVHTYFKTCVICNPHWTISVQKKKKIAHYMIKTYFLSGLINMYIKSWGLSFIKEKWPKIPKKLTLLVGLWIISGDIIAGVSMGVFISLLKGSNPNVGSCSGDNILLGL